MSQVTSGNTHPRPGTLTLFHVVGISREAAVAWIVSDSKLVSFTSRHLGTGPTQHDTFVRARCDRVVPPAALDLPLPLSRYLHHLQVSRRGMGEKTRREIGDIRGVPSTRRPRLQGTPGLAGSHPRSHGSVGSYACVSLIIPSTCVSGPACEPHHECSSTTVDATSLTPRSLTVRRVRDEERESDRCTRQDVGRRR
ncbi:hypothetical protein X777_09524 [Ooceraea biroi]|uniref:Uncharacterized protein n=1 Tax=Ooceraea biroi TaxID=2015173 RepID=A0A026W6M5_OOCBI|nr:hypothetical protein X777_09524 [Ooceraea biroi]